MKTPLLLFFALLLSVLGASAATFDEANQLYDQGRFEQAKTAARKELEVHGLTI